LGCMFLLLSHLIFVLSVVVVVVATNTQLSV
jgi:hypothetical protein